MKQKFVFFGAMSDESKEKSRSSRRRRPRRSSDQSKRKPDSSGQSSGSGQSGQGGNAGQSGQPGQSGNSRKGSRPSRNRRGGQGRGAQSRGRRDSRRRSGAPQASGGKLRVLVIGSGGREHALVWKLSQSPKVGQIYAIPGNSGMSKLARCVDMKLDRIRDISAYAARNNIDLTVVGPEGPLAAGIVDEFNKRNLKVFGPTKAAAQLESSKAFAKEFMRKYSIPTASFRVFDNPNEAITLCRTAQYPLVIKADGLAAGKGVVIVDNFTEAVETIKQIMVDKIFGSAGKRILIEDFITGPEVSIMGFCDGESCWPMIPSQDHKRIGEGDTGPNTGGMGAYAPATFLTDEMMAEIQERVLDTCVAGMAREGHPYKGVIYAGLMLTDSGPKVLEFNCRFGDPETQVVLPLLESDLADIMLRIARKQVRSSAKKSARRSAQKKAAPEETSVELPEQPGPLYLRELIEYYPPPDEDEENETPEAAGKPRDIKWSSGAAACVILAAGGYPANPERGKKIRGLADYSKEGCEVFFAGVKRVKEAWVTAGGRVLCVTGLGENLQQALKRAYAVVDRISFDGMQFRRDIGHQASGQAAQPVSESE